MYKLEADGNCKRSGNEENNIGNYDLGTGAWEFCDSAG